MLSPTDVPIAQTRSMCGRYAASRDAATLVEEFEILKSPDQELAADYNVAPTNPVYLVADRVSKGSGDLQRELAVAKWGLVPSWAKDPKIGNRMINARWESVAQKPAYRSAFAKRRCLLPADGYYEWYTPTDSEVERTAKGKPIKQPYFIHPADGSILAMAGLYEWWHDPALPEDDPGTWLRTTTVITTSATDDLGMIHGRMPMYVQPDRWGAWLDPDPRPAREILDLLIPSSPRLAAGRSSQAGCEQCPQ
jgi:putative SOS response-associated peptidase YedK